MNSLYIRELQLSDEDDFLNAMQRSTALHSSWMTTPLSHHDFLVLSKVFTEMELHRLEANIQPDNINSINLVKAHAFRKEGYSPRYLKINGEWRDFERWAITYEDWLMESKKT